MSNPSKDHPSVRVQAPPGGHSNNIFGTEFEQSAANKKKHMGSDIFGTKQDNVESAPAKPNRNTGNNIFGNEPEETHARGGTIAGQFKQTQMKSNIFGTDEPTTTRVPSDKNKSNIFGTDEPTSARAPSDKNKSNIFGTNDKDDQTKRQTHVRQGLRVGYNPINGEAYDKPTDSTVKKPEEENSNGHTAAANSTETGNNQVAPSSSTESNNSQASESQAAPANSTENKTAQKPVEKVDDNANGNNAQKNVHTSVRVFHPPGGKSNGPLW